MSIITLYKLDEQKKLISSSLSGCLCWCEADVCVCVCCASVNVPLWCFFKGTKKVQWWINVNSRWKKHLKHFRNVISSDHMTHLIIWLLRQREMIDYCIDMNELSQSRLFKTEKEKQKKTDRRCLVDRLWVNGGSRWPWWQEGKERSRRGVMDRDRAENWSTCNMTQMDKSI